ncbi:MAG: response regulator [Desulfobacteraceae bacterium]|nr:response regulator [Desulfobacteraceae bacterium]
MSRLNILVVDDDPVTVILIQKKLVKEDYAVDTAEDGQQAVDKLTKRYYDVILTDLMMPGDIDGIGVLEAAKEWNIKTEVILITAFASIENAIEAMKKGAVDYLQKPINFDELLLRLEKIKNMKMLMKNATDLREAMDVTEQSSAGTIQVLELEVGKLQTLISDINELLLNDNLDAQSRIERVIEKIDT